VGRSRQPEIRERLLDRCTDHALAAGLPDRLEAFAVASGTSTRMLLYHFGTKEALLRAVLRRARDRQRQDFQTLLLTPLEDGLRTLGRPELATLVLAVIRGLIMDLDATGDTVRVDRALADLLASLRAPASG
jgi:AcrR family transcriptional regulator